MGDCVQVYRYRASSWVSNGKIILQQQWIPMRRLSCKGECCEASDTRRCYSPLVDAEEGGVDCLKIKPPREGLVDGSLYRMVFVAEGTDWETGYVDDWHWDAIPVQESKP
jgi:hypothetical protein